MSIRELVISEIKSKKSIDVSEFINLCLHSDDGYYSNKNPIGKQSDFITAPEINQIFGELITICLIKQWEKFGKPNDFNLIEFGPGKGTLMLDIL